jgi:hypothetical protein
LWARARNLLENRESFEAFQLTTCSKEDLEKDLVHDTLPGYAAPIFTQV